MNSFLSFAADRGLIIEHLSMGRWVRTRTKDHPKKRNGAYLFQGDFGVVQNWAQMDRAETWLKDRESKPDPDLLRRMAEASARQDRKRLEDAKQAAQTAQAMLKRANTYTHPYLTAKGFPEAKGCVLDDALVIAMKDLRGAIVGAQTIKMVDGEWQKKMLFGTRAKGAVHPLGNERKLILCEGYATGLSIQAALNTFPSYTSVLVCFSAGNLVTVAAQVQNASVIADNDASQAGQKAAEASGLPWAMPDIVGEDANDVYVKDGIVGVKRLLAKIRR